MRIIGSIDGMTDDDVQRLVRLGTRGINTDDVLFIVGNIDWGYKGFAYRDLPASVRKLMKRGERYAIKIWVCTKDSYYPASNVHDATCGKWERVRVSSKSEQGVLMHDEEDGIDGDDFRYRENKHHIYWSEDNWIVQTRVCQRHPYGGKRSPVIVFNSAAEALVGIAAHEAKHVWQFRNRKPMSEVVCERHTLKVLERFRAEALVTA